VDSKGRESSKKSWCDYPEKPAKLAWAKKSPGKKVLFAIIAPAKYIHGSKLPKTTGHYKGPGVIRAEN